jgi:Methane oxygenase PmoA
MESPELHCGGRPVGVYVHRPDLPARLSPRPYLHPLTTLGGVPVTELTPPDHPHHLGACLAVPDVAGQNFWGGRTFVRHRGPTELDNHGVQRHTRWVHRSAAGFTEELSWTAARRELLQERRTVAVRALTGPAWALDFAFTLTNTTPEPLRIGSPATNGRPGAGYGGFFWRAPAGAAPPRVFTPGADGEEAVHGRPAGWLALTGPDWTLVFSGPADPWFVRTREYPGVGSALAWEHPLTLPPGAALTRRVVTAVADGRLDRDGAAALARESAPPGGTPPGPPADPPA